MLNYLPLTHLQGALFVEVDPRHILGIKQDHGAYFEEVIRQCGLETKNVVIVMPVNSHYARHYQELVTGLDNYRRRGYQIALKFDYVAQESQSFELIPNCRRITSAYRRGIWNRCATMPYLKNCVI